MKFNQKLSFEHVPFAAADMAALQEYALSSAELAAAGEHSLPFVLSMVEGSETKIDVVELAPNQYRSPFVPYKSETATIWVQLGGISVVRAGNSYQRYKFGKSVEPSTAVRFPDGARRSIDNHTKEIAKGALLRIIG